MGKFPPQFAHFYQGWKNLVSTIQHSFYVLTMALVLCASTIGSEEASFGVSIEVHGSHETGNWMPIWNYFGYDEPNYTYTDNGRKLLGELSVLSHSPVYVRTHNLFTSGDGSASLKWGSTNVYTEGASGDPVYDWKIVDQIFDAYHEFHIKPLVELGFMPEALSTHPQPYRHNFPNGSIFTGWAYPPKDFNKWADLVFHFTEHLRDRYGKAETSTWLWEVWNEPDIGYWRGTQEEYFKLYDYSAEAVLKALPGAAIGGPDTTGPANDNAVDFLRAFLQHCAHGKNHASGKMGAPLSFISFHPKGAPTSENGMLRMGSSHHLAAVKRGFQVVASFPEWRDTPIILGESDPEGCAACSAEQHPENKYRNGALYAAYTVAIMNQIYGLAGQAQINFRGAVTWAFEFENQPYFAGYRELATNGIDKAVLNAFRMLGMMGGGQLDVHSGGVTTLDQMLREGTGNRPDIEALATHRGREIEILVWSYSDEEIPVLRTGVNLNVKEIAGHPRRVWVEHFRIDHDHSNAYEVWRAMGSPASPTAKELKIMEERGHLQQVGSPRLMSPENGSLSLNFYLPKEAVSLIRISW